MAIPESTTSCNILTQMRLDKERSRTSDPKGDTRREERQIELVELMIQAKRRKLIDSLSARLDYLAEERITTATFLADLRLSSAASDVVSIATRIGARRTHAQSQTAGSEPSLPPGTLDTNFIDTTRPLPRTITSRTQPQMSSVTPKPPQLPRAPRTSAQLATMPKLSAPLTNSRPPPRTLPKRPTEMTYEELRRNPDFKRLSWSWTGIIVGVPVLLVTSWVMWKDYKRRMMERKLGLDPSLARGPPALSHGSKDH